MSRPDTGENTSTMLLSDEEVAAMTADYADQPAHTDVPRLLADRALLVAELALAMKVVEAARVGGRDWIRRPLLDALDAFDAARKP